MEAKLADLKQMIDELATLAETASVVLPQAAIAGGAARIGSKILSIVDDLKPHAPTLSSAQQLQDAEEKLMAALSSKSAATSSRLRG